MKTKLLLSLLGCVSIIYSSVCAQDVTAARTALLSADFEAASSALAGANATAEVQLLQSLVDIASWVEQDVPDLGASVGADADAASAYADLSSYLDGTEGGGESQPIYASSTPLFMSESAGVQTYLFSAEEAENNLVLYNRSEQAQAVEFSVVFGDTSRLIRFYSNRVRMGSVDPDYFSIWYDSEYWYDGTLDKTFSLTLEPGDYIRLEQNNDPDDPAGYTELSFASQPEIEVQNGEYVLYTWEPDVANALFDYELIGVDGQAWQVGYLDPIGDFSLDYWISGTQLFEWYTPNGAMLSFEYTGSTARQVDLGFYGDGTSFSGTLYLNGIELGRLDAYANFLNQSGALDSTPGEVDEIYTLSLWLEPADVLSLQIEPSWRSFWYVSPSDSPALGLAFDVPSDFSGQNGTGYTNVYPKLTPGTTSDTFADFLLGNAAPTAQLLTTLIDRLASLEDGFSVAFDPEETGLVERIRVEYEDTQLLLAFLKFIKGTQLIFDLYDAGAVDATYTTYQEYLGDPVALWEDYPELLTLVQSRSAQGAQAKALFEQAVSHYTSIESSFWSRQSGPTESYLFEVGTTTETERSEFSTSLSQFVELLNGPVALTDFDAGASPEQFVSLQPLVGASPVDLRSVLPEFNDQGFFARSSADLLAAGFVTGLSNLELDQMLAAENALFIPAPASLVGKVLLIESNWYPGEYEAFYFNSDTELTFVDDQESATHSYQWDASTGVLENLTWSEQIELEFETGVTGNSVTSSEEEWWGEPGSFILYEGDWNLDSDNQEDAVQLAAGEMLYFEYYDEPFLNFDGDWDGDGIPDGDEAAEGADPQLFDTDGDGFDDWEEVVLYSTDPADANSKLYAAPASLPTGLYHAELVETDVWEPTVTVAEWSEELDLRVDGSVFYGFGGRATAKSDWFYEVAEDGLSAVLTVEGLEERYEYQLIFTNASGTVGNLRLAEYYLQGESFVEYYSEEEVSGTFEFLGGSLEIDSAWRISDDFSGSELDAELWQSEYGSEVAYLTEGRLDFSGALSDSTENDSWQQISGSRLLPLDQDWMVVSELFNENSGTSSEVELNLSNYDATQSPLDIGFTLTPSGLIAGINQYSYTGGARAESVVLSGDSVHVRSVYDASARVLSLEYELDGADNGWNWNSLIVVDLEAQTAAIWDGSDMVSTAADPAFSDLSAAGYLAMDLAAWAYIVPEYEVISPEGPSYYNSYSGVSVGAVGESFPEYDVEYEVISPEGGYEPSYPQSSTLEPLGFASVQIFEVAESQGESDLLIGEAGYFIDSASVPVVSEGAQVVAIEGWTYLGAEPDESTGYVVLLQNDSTEAYYRWTVEASGAIVVSDALSLYEARAYEVAFNQDFDLDGELGNPPAEIVEASGSVALLYSSELGYFINSESLPVLSEGAQVGAIPGWTYLGVESDGSTGYWVLLQNDSTGTYYRWTVDASGEITGSDVLSLSGVRAYEVSFAQDFDGDGEYGNPPATLFETAGDIDLLYRADAGYFIGDENRALSYEGSQMGELAGWTYLGVEAGSDYAYDVFVRNDLTGEYVRWGVDSNGAIVFGEFLTAVEVRAYEVSFDQDLDGDGERGNPPATPFETAGSVSLLYRSDAGYFIGDENRALSYEGSQMDELAGWTYLGVEAGTDYAYDVFVRNDLTGEYVRWGVDSSGAIVFGEFLTAVQVRAYEVSFDQDLDGDGEQGNPPATAFETAGSVSLLYRSDAGYFIGDENRALSYQGSQMGELAGWTYLGVEAGSDYAYDVFVRNDLTGEYVRWGVDASGAIVFGEFLSAVQVRAYEVSFDQDLDGDGEYGNPPATPFESEGSVSLLYRADAGYFIGDENRALSYQGSQMGELAGWTYLGVEAGTDYAYDVFVRNDLTGEYVRWGVDASGAIVFGEFLTAVQVRAYEATFDQDLDGDGERGNPPATSFESYGSVSLLYRADAGYFIGDENRALSYEGSQMDELAGWTYLGVEAGSVYAYDVFVRNDLTGEYVRWGVDSSGAIVFGEFLTASGVGVYEVSFEQDLNGDAYLGVPPTLAPVSLLPGTVLEIGDGVTFIGSNNNYVSFYSDGYYGVDAGTFSYTRINETSAAYSDSNNTGVDLDGLYAYESAAYTLNFSSESSFTRSLDGLTFDLTEPSDLAPDSLVGLTAITSGYGYSAYFEQGYSGGVELNFTTASTGTYSGDEYLSVNYTYQKIGPREGRINATGYSPSYGTVRAEYIFHFLTETSGYFVGSESFPDVGETEYEWGTFDLTGVTDNDNPPLNAQLDGDVVTITFSTPGFNPIVYAYNNSGGNSTTDTVSGDIIFAQYQSLGATRFNLSKSNAGAGPYYAYVLDITFSDGLNATFTGTYDADGFDNSNPLVAVSGTVTIVE
jgi:hypothetical protein